MNRRLFLGIALSSFCKAADGLPGLPHFAPKAKRIIYLFQSGGPSQIELFDYKPRLVEFQNTDLPASVRMGQRLTGMSASQSTFPVVPSKFVLSQHGESGAWVSELLPYTAKIADRLTFIKTVNTEEINHDPAATFLQTGHQLAGCPSMGSWLAYGLGSENRNLPAFIAMISSHAQYARASFARFAASSARGETALKPMPGGSIRPFCEPATVTSTPQASWR